VYEVSHYRICTRCGKAQEWLWDYWATLPDWRARVLRTKVVNVGPYYKLP